LDYFEPFINELDLSHNLDFLEDWSAFIQKLSNIFSFYSSENDNEDVIVFISFPSKGKTVDYFIYFTKYQNHIHWNKRILYKIVKNAIPDCIRNKLRYSKRVQKGIAHWDKQTNDVLAPNCMLKVRGEIIKVEGL